MKHLRAISIVLMLCLIFPWAGVPSAQAQVNAPSESSWLTNGPVYAITQGADKIYIGGRFSLLGPSTGCGAPLDCDAGRVAGKTPRVDGAVFACVADGAGGWFIGGHFKNVGGLARAYLAHILADGAVDPAWAPSIKDSADSPYNMVLTLALSGSTLYVGGWFELINGQSRHSLAALDATTGALKDWNPNGNVNGLFPGEIRALAVSGTTVYVGGAFTSMGGQPRNALAAIDAATGQVLPWNPNENNIEGSGVSVRALAVSGSTLYAGGVFRYMGRNYRRGMAAIDAVTGAVSDWNPDVVGSSSYPGVYAIALRGSSVFIGGDFTNVGGKPRTGLAELDANTTGTVTAWDPKVNVIVRALAVSSSTLYVGGFVGFGRSSAFAADAVTGALTSWEPNQFNFTLEGGTNWDGCDVNALAVSGSRIYLGGLFRSVGGLTRNCLAALDSATGALLPWRSGPIHGPGSTAEVRSLLDDGARLYVGGMFDSLAGQSRKGIAALDAATGAVLAWNPQRFQDSTDYSPTIYALARRGATVYAGGAFSRLGGQARHNLAALDEVTGDATAWNPGPDNTVTCLALDGARVYAGGVFKSIGGQPRQYLAALDAEGAGTATAWNPGPDAYVRCLAVGGSIIYAGGDFAHIGGKARGGLAALDPVTGAATTWDPQPGQPLVYALALDGLRLYAGGDGYYFGGATRAFLAAYDRATGKSTGWAPQTSGIGEIATLAVCDSGLYAGSSGGRGFARFIYPTAVDRAVWLNME